jgi:hypothetical protein
MTPTERETVMKITPEYLAEVRKLTRGQYRALHRCARVGRYLGRLHDKFTTLRVAFSYSDEYNDAFVLDGVEEILRYSRKDCPLTERQQRIRFLSGRHSGPVYYWYQSRDCDLCEVGYAVAFQNQMDADIFIEDAYDSAEGPTSFSRLTHEQYLEAENEHHRRDIAAEMMGY